MQYYLYADEIAVVIKGLHVNTALISIESIGVISDRRNIVTFPDIEMQYSYIFVSPFRFSKTNVHAGVFRVELLRLGEAVCGERFLLLFRTTQCYCQHTRYRHKSWVSTF